MHRFAQISLKSRDHRKENFLPDRFLPMVVVLLAVFLTSCGHAPLTEQSKNRDGADEQGTAAVRLVECTKAFVASSLDSLNDCNFRIEDLGGKAASYDIGGSLGLRRSPPNSISNADLQSIIQSQSAETIISIAEVAKFVSPGIHQQYFAEKLICGKTGSKFVSNPILTLRALTSGISSGACSGSAYVEAWTESAVATLAEARGSTCDYLKVRSLQASFYIQQNYESVARASPRLSRVIDRAYLQNTHASRQCGAQQESTMVNALPTTLRLIYNSVSQASASKYNANSFVGLTDQDGQNHVETVQKLKALCDGIYPGWNIQFTRDRIVLPARMPPGCYRIAQLGEAQQEISLSKDPFASYGVILFAEGAPVLVNSDVPSTTILVAPILWSGGSAPIGVVGFPVIFGIADQGKLPSEYIAFHFIVRKNRAELERRFFSSQINGNSGGVQLVREPLTRERLINVLDKRTSELIPARISSSLGTTISPTKGIQLHLLSDPTSICDRVKDVRVRHRDIIVRPDWDGMISPESAEARHQFCASVADSQCLAKILDTLACDGASSPSSRANFRQGASWKMDATDASIQ